jgi:hypothetical protein
MKRGRVFRSNELPLFSGYKSKPSKQPKSNRTLFVCLSYPDDGGSMFFRNVTKLLPDYMALQPMMPSLPKSINAFWAMLHDGGWIRQNRRFRFSFPKHNYEATRRKREKERNKINKVGYKTLYLPLVRFVRNNKA